MKEETTVIQTFALEDFGQFRYIKMDDGTIWFAVVDVCKTLELKNSRMVASRLKQNEKRKFNLRYSGKAGNPNIWFVNEPGLYRLIFMSKKPEAERFQDLVYHEILPQIRQTGAYNPKARVPLTPREKILAEIGEEMQKPRYKEMFKKMGLFALDILLFEKYGDDNYEPCINSVEKITEDGKTYNVMHMGYIVNGIKIF